MKFKDFERLLAEARESGISSSDTVMFLNRDSGNIFSVKEIQVEPLTFTEGNADSVGGTVWIIGTEY